jgi:hypothetical protein
MFSEIFGIDHAMFCPHLKRPRHDGWTGLLRVREGQPRTRGRSHCAYTIAVTDKPINLTEVLVNEARMHDSSLRRSSTPTVYFEPDRIADVRIALMCVKAVTLQMRQSSVIETEQGTVANYWI